MALFIKFDGVDGEAQRQGPQELGDLLSMSWGLHKAGAGTTGQTRRRGVVTVEDVCETKEFDKASPKLAESMCEGRCSPRSKSTTRRPTARAGRPSSSTN